MKRLFAVVHESPVGTFETCRQPLGMSAYRGRPEVAGARAKRRE
jgi:hypothetical protein